MTLARWPVLVAVMALAACTTEDASRTAREPVAGRTIAITATEHAFRPSRIVVDPGEHLVVVLRNEGTMPHSILFELPAADHELDRAVEPGEAGQIDFDAPHMLGDHVFFCPIDGHRDRGMEGFIDVVAATSEPEPSLSSRALNRLWQAFAR